MKRFITNTKYPISAGENNLGSLMKIKNALSNAYDTIESNYNEHFDDIADIANLLDEIDLVLHDIAIYIGE